MPVKTTMSRRDALEHAEASLKTRSRSREDDLNELAQKIADDSATKTDIAGVRNAGELTTLRARVARLRAVSDAAALALAHPARQAAAAAASRVATEARSKAESANKAVETATDALRICQADARESSQAMATLSRKLDGDKQAELAAIEGAIAVAEVAEREAQRELAQAKRTDVPALRVSLAARIRSATENAKRLPAPAQKESARRQVEALKQQLAALEGQTKAKLCKAAESALAKAQKALAEAKTAPGEFLKSL